MSAAPTPQREHVLRFLQTAVGRPIDDSELGETLCQTIFNALSREEEVRVADRDQWGNWDWAQAEAHTPGDQRTPWIDEIIARQFAAEPAITRWPHGKRFALCLTHDVDSVSHRRLPFASVVEAARRVLGDGSVHDRVVALAHASAKYGLQYRSGRAANDAQWRYEKWIQLEGSLGFRSTFFAFPEVVARPHAWDANYRLSDRVKFEGTRMSAGEMFRRIAEQGWDVGVHGSYHSATSSEILARERRQIEAATQVEAITVRQHYLHYDAAVTPAVQYAAGLRADSTQGFNSGLGFRAGTSLPYRCWDWSSGKGLPMLEIPQIVMDGAVFSDAVTGASVDASVACVVRLLDRVESVGGCLTLNWHPEYIRLPKYVQVYDTVLREAHRRGAWGCSVRDVYDWWTKQ